MRIASLLLVILVGFSFSCGTTMWEGNKFDPTKRDQIVKNRTTTGEIEALFGKPFKVEKIAGGKDKYVYYHKYEEYVHWYTLPKSTMQRLEVVLQNRVVTDYNYDRVSIDPMKD